MPKKPTFISRIWGVVIMGLCARSTFPSWENCAMGRPCPGQAGMVDGVRVPGRAPRPSPGRAPHGAAGRSRRERNYDPPSIFND